MTDLVVQRKEGLYCPAGRFLHRSVAAGRSRRHHARARRPRAPRQRALPRRRAGRRRAAHPPRRDRPADRCRTARRSTISACVSAFIPPATCSARRRCGSSTTGGSGSCRATTTSPAARRCGEDNPTCAPFEPVRCHCFITESTFGLPIYRWQPQAELFADDRRLVARQRRSRPRQPDPRLRLRQGAAHPDGRRPLDRPDRRARRGRAAQPRLPRRRRRPSRDADRHRDPGQVAVPRAP